GAGKSVLTSILASWFLLRNPNCTIMVLSATAQKAVEFISMTRRICDIVPYCNHLAPHLHMTDNAFAFNCGARTKVGQDASVFARGITSQITGSHADIVISDDIEIEGNSDTAVQREKLLGRLHELEQIRNPGGRVIMLGTPQTKDSIYNQLAQSYRQIKFPAVIPDPTVISQVENVADWVMQLPGMPGESTQPERFTDELLLERKAKIGPTKFDLHYRLDCTLSDVGKYPLRLADLLCFDVDPEVFPAKVIWANGEPYRNLPSEGMAGDVLYRPMHISDEYLPYQETAVFVDPSGRGNDETAVCVASLASGYIVVHDLIGLDGGYDEATLTKVCKIALNYNATSIRVESNFGDGAVAALLRPLAAKYVGNCAVDEYRVFGAKEERMLSNLEPVMAGHRLVMNTRAIRDPETQKQITRLTNLRGALKHDDRVDVLSAAVEYWKKYIQVDVDDLADRNLRKAEEDYINAWTDDKRRGNMISEARGGSGTSRVTTIYNDQPHRPGGKQGPRSIFGRNQRWGL
ncbi:MAG: phage terminase large subunit, partial [Actinomycetales bacterium]|nr:phage terminase large subunit [Actinomycetales bacterium]